MDYFISQRCNAISKYVLYRHLALQSNCGLVNNTVQSAQPKRQSEEAICGGRLYGHFALQSNYRLVNNTIQSAQPKLQGEKAICGGRSPEQ